MTIGPHGIGMAGDTIIGQAPDGVCLHRSNVKIVIPNEGCPFPIRRHHFPGRIDRLFPGHPARGRRFHASDGTAVHAHADLARLAIDPEGTERQVAR